MAVYTPVSAKELSRFLERYDLGALQSHKGIGQGVENTNYDVRTSGGRFVLTLFEKRVAAPDLPFFIAFMEHLAVAGIPCPSVIRDRRGEALGMLNGRMALIVTFMEGKAVDVPEADHCAAVGDLIARMHLAAADFRMSRPNAMDLPEWRRLAHKCFSANSGLDPETRSLIENELSSIQEEWPMPEAMQRGIIHADLFPDNVFFSDQAISAVLDFYFSCSDFLVYDLALAVNAWCFDADGLLNPKKFSAMMDEYQLIRPLEDIEKTNFILIARGAALRIAMTRLHDTLFKEPEALVTLKNPHDYLSKMKYYSNEAVSC